MLVQQADSRPCSKSSRRVERSEALTRTVVHSPLQAERILWPCLECASRLISLSHLNTFLRIYSFGFAHYPLLDGQTFGIPTYTLCGTKIVLQQKLLLFPYHAIITVLFPLKLLVECLCGMPSLEALVDHPMMA